MGEYAEMMLDGTCCACCGEYLGTDAGFPVYCAGCAPDFDVEAFTGLPVERRRKKRGTPPAAKPCVCGTCGKSFRSKGARRQHSRRVHPQTPAAATQAAAATSGDPSPASGTSRVEVDGPQDMKP